MSAETDTDDETMRSSDIVREIGTVEEGQQVHLATKYYSFASPLCVEVVDEVLWQAAAGEDWRARRVTLEGDKGAEYFVSIVEGLDNDQLRLRSTWDEHRGDLTQFRPRAADVSPETVRDVVEQVEDLEQLAAMFDVDVDEAEDLATEAGVLEDLQDDADGDADQDVDDTSPTGSGETLAGHDPMELVDALIGAQTIHQASRDLSLDRGETERLLTTLGLFEDLQSGREPLDRTEVQRAVKGATGARLVGDVS